MSSSISVDSLHKSFARNEVLHGLSFELPPGSVLGLIGPNGAGKTTTLRCLLDIIRPSSGTLRVLGEDPRHSGPELRRRIGYLPGELILESRVTGRRLLNHFAALSGPVKRGRIEELAERLAVPLDKQVRELSKGNKQKLGLIQAFMHDPELLVLDEPTSGLDPLLQQEFLAMVAEVRNDGRSVLLSSHVLSELQQSADRVAILRAGTIVANASVDELRANAVRKLRVRLEDGQEALDDATRRLSAVPGVDGLRTLPDGQLEASVHDGIRPLLTALAALPVTDVVLEEPDLEEAVLTLYGTNHGNGHPATATGHRTRRLERHARKES
ncbi:MULTISPECIES: ABC transporter ATP-binding protein [Arthrobacter]|uniref:ABC transporter ATP-binding protein n=2 Tax=Arthrobacter TaxID=1663 RepID=A0ABU9KMS9_9MICC|nr:ABC transporter ATP-binding protein [Arthrobacter sp. YJM1]MDP5227974.1 ABC transporter ATP-binding protein [Arthrobacter sp. YJM1]